MWVHWDQGRVRSLCVEGNEKFEVTRALCFVKRKVFGFTLSLLSVPTAGEHSGIGFRVAQLGMRHVVTLDENRCSSARRVRKPRLAVQQT
jgi:hypothetical protein